MKGRSGFTLVELLVTASMLAVLAAAGLVVLDAGIRSAQKTRRCGRMVAYTERALSAMAMDLRAAVEHDGVRLLSLDAQYEGRDADTIDFIAQRVRQWKQEPGVTGRCEIGYYIDNDPDTEERWLMRRQDDTLDEDPLEGGALSQAGPFVSELNLEFFDGLDWVSGWDDSQRFPEAVYISIVVVDPDENEEPLHFETTVTIPAGKQ